MDQPTPSMNPTLIAGLLMLAVLCAVMVSRPARLEHVAATEPVDMRIDLNSADAPTLCLLPKIGPGIAQRIVTDRRAFGPYATVDDLARVPYVGEKTVAAIRPWAVVAGR